MGAVVFVLLFWCAFGGGIGFAIGNTKGRGPQGFVLGFLLGFIGWLIVAVMEPTEVERRRRVLESLTMGAAIAPTLVNGTPTPSRACPWCAETIKAAAIVCRYCGREVEPVTLAHEDSLRADAPTDAARASLVGSIQQLLDERQIRALGVAEALASLLPGVGAIARVGEAVARLGDDGKQGVIAAAGSDAAIWWADGRPAEYLDLHTVLTVERSHWFTTLHAPEHAPIVIRSGTVGYAKQWVAYMQRYGATNTKH